MAQEITLSHTTLKSDISEERISAYKALAVEHIFNKETKTNRVEPRDPDTISNKPYLPEYSEGGPEKLIYSMRELRGVGFEDEW